MNGTTPNSPFGAQDPFSAFWQDLMARSIASGMTGMGQNPSLEAMNQMRRIFFDTFAQHAEKFMRSEAFLQSMKQAMDAGLAWQQTLNQAMQKNLAAAQMPSRADVEHVALLVRGVEDRLSHKLDALQQRIENLEDRHLSNGESRQTGGASTKKSAGRTS